MHGPVFQWLSTSPHIPIRWDLRLADWSMQHVLDERATAGMLPVVLDWRRNSRLPRWQGVATPARVVAVGVDDPRERTFLLARGLGDAIGSRVTHVELEARVTRIGHRARALPRELHAGPVTLDLFQRDGRAGGRWLGLHPREFALLWRLAETPGASVTRAQLLRDVWRLERAPETNSLAVHVSRLRAKLHAARCGWLVRTEAQGSYCLAIPAQRQGHDAPPTTGLVGHDAYQGRKSAFPGETST